MDAAEAFKSLISLQRRIDASEENAQSSSARANELAIELSDFKELLVGTVTELEAVGRLNFRGVLYVSKGVSRAAIKKYKQRHPNITVVTNTVGYVRVFYLP